MGLLLDLLQVLGRKVRIDLCGRKAGMTEHFLHTAQVRPTHEQIACKGVAHRMGRERRVKTSKRERLLEDRTDHSGRKRITAR